MSDRPTLEDIALIQINAAELAGFAAYGNNVPITSPPDYPEAHTRATSNTPNSLQDAWRRGWRDAEKVAEAQNNAPRFAKAETDKND